MRIKDVVGGLIGLLIAFMKKCRSCGKKLKIIDERVRRVGVMTILKCGCEGRIAMIRNRSYYSVVRVPEDYHWDNVREVER